MPNWCQNKIHFEGGEHLDDLKGILIKAQGVLDFEDFGHTPDVELDSQYNSVHFDKDSVIIKCMTAWEPPIEFLKHMSLMYPGTKITMQYMEPSMYFAGESTFKAHQEHTVWTSQKNNWYSEYYEDLEYEDQEILYEEIWDHAPGSEGIKEVMDKMFNKEISDFIFQHFGTP
jgi:hypothetical protein